MTVETAVQEILASSTGITALCPASRIKVPGAWQDLALPYLVHFPVSLDPIRTHDGGVEPLKIWGFYQVSIFADAYSTGTALTTAVLAAMDGHHLVGPLAQGVDVQVIAGKHYLGWDDESETHHFALNFRIAEALV